jgi:hypothetical protein
MLPHNEPNANKIVQPINARAGALWAIRRGLWVLPVKPNSKDPFDRERGDDPVLCGGVRIATNDPKVAEGWFRHNPDINYGIAMRDGLVTLDCDRKHASFAADYLDLCHPTTLELISGRGGRHIVLRVDFDAGQRDLAGATSINVRARGGFIVGPASVVLGSRYTILDDSPVADCPPKIAERISRRGERAADNATPVAELDTPAALAWGETFAKEAPGASKGDRNDKLFRLAGALKDKGLSRETTRELLTEHWCPRCDPPYEDWGEIERTIDSAYNNGMNPPGIDSPELHFDNVAGDPAVVAAREWWDRHRTGVPKGKLTEGSSDISIEDIVKWRESALVKGILHPGEQAVLYGDPGDGKSFIALDLAWHIAQGKDWHGFKVAKAPVLYIALEGVEGFRARIKAAEKHHGEAAWFRRQLAHVSLIRGDAGNQGLATVIAAAKEVEELCGRPPGLIIVDTQARAMAGDDENSGKDVMHFVDHRAGVIARKTSAAVLTVAHTNVRGDLRGSLLLRGAVSVVLKTDRDGDNRSLTGEKVKDGDEEPLFDFTLHRVHLANDSDGKGVNACVILATPPKPANTAAKDSEAQARYRASYKVIADRVGRANVPLADVAEEFMKGYTTGERDPEKMKKAKYEAWRWARKKPPRGLRVYNNDGTELIGPDKGADVEFDMIDGDAEKRSGAESA